MRGDKSNHFIIHSVRNYSMTKTIMPAVFSSDCHRGSLTNMKIARLGMQILLNIMFHAPMGRFQLELIIILPIFILFIYLDGTTMEK